MLQALSELQHNSTVKDFRKIWFGMAGCDSAAAAREAEDLARRFFQLPTNCLIVVTNDCALLSAAIASPPHVDATRGITLISGTGSIAACYDFASPNRFEPIARSGGLGHLLGDEGNQFCAPSNASMTLREQVAAFGLANSF